MLLVLQCMSVFICLFLQYLEMYANMCVNLVLFVVFKMLFYFLKTLTCSLY